MDRILNVLLVVPVFLFALCFHEFAHAWVATRRGDPTPKALGRLTLHPLAHADMLGTFILPTLCVFLSGPFFGWAKPVPVDISKLKRGRLDMALVAFAGPASNLILAFLATAFLWGVRQAPPFELTATLATFSVLAIHVNLMLAFFNLLPIPPLDGFMIVQAGLRESWVRQIERVSGIITLSLMFLLFSGGLSLLSLPVVKTSKWLFSLAGLATN